MQTVLDKLGAAPIAEISAHNPLLGAGILMLFFAVVGAVAYGAARMFRSGEMN